ncbi:MAG: hypothetical protein R3B45_12240 [Bdellovibrionota bacterium]
MQSKREALRFEEGESSEQFFLLGRGEFTVFYFDRRNAQGRLGVYGWQALGCDEK